MTDKTIADVLDKSIDKLSGGAAELAKAAKQVAPHAWEVAVRQQVIEGGIQFAFHAALGAVFVYCLVLTRRRWGGLVDGAGQADFPPAPYILAAILLWGAGLSLSCAFDALPRVINPQYYAAKAILEAVK